MNNTTAKNLKKLMLSFDEMNSMSEYENNVADMHKALKEAWELLDADDRQLIAYSDTGALMDIIKPALAMPPRNCDIGSPEEQAKRFDLFCSKHYLCYDMDGEGNACPCKKKGYKTIIDCGFTWAQMPYKEDGRHESL